MALNGLFCADVPLRNYSLTQAERIRFIALRWTIFLFCSFHYRVYDCLCRGHWYWVMSWTTLRLFWVRDCLVLLYARSYTTVGQALLTSFANMDDFERFW